MCSPVPMNVMGLFVAATLQRRAATSVAGEKAVYMYMQHVSGQ